MLTIHLVSAESRSIPPCDIPCLQGPGVPCPAHVAEKHALEIEYLTNSTCQDIPCCSPDVLDAIFLLVGLYVFLTSLAIGSDSTLPRQSPGMEPHMSICKSASSWVADGCRKWKTRTRALYMQHFQALTPGTTKPFIAASRTPSWVRRRSVALALGRSSSETCPHLRVSQCPSPNLGV